MVRLDSTVIRAHHFATGARGGLIHARTNAEGLPIALLLSPGEAHDSTAFSDLMDEYDADPDVMLADRGYDSGAIRDDVRAREVSQKSQPRRTVARSIQ